MKALLGLALVASLAGCKVAATADEYRWVVKAPSQVALAPHSKLHFVVEARTSDHRPVAEVPYMWVVEWVGVHGVRHQGWSSREEEITVKGSPGTAHLRILLFGPDHELIDVTRASFEVTEAQAPAK